MTELQTALAFVREIAARPVPESERRAAERCLVDSIGCALGGARDPVTLSTLAALRPGAEGVSLLGLEGRLRPADAVLVHGAAIRCMDFNDVFSRRNNQHPSEFVVPVVLALAELGDWSGAKAVEATAIGYRIFLALGEAWQGLLGRGWAPSATLGRASTAALIGVLQGHDDAVIANAMAIGAITAPTLGAVFKGQLSQVKSLVNGMACRGGWEAVDLAAAGVTGPMNAFEATGGFDQMAGGPFLAPDPAAPMLTAEDVSLKAFPTVFMTHAAIAAAAALAPRTGGAGNIRKVRVFAPEQAVTMAAAEPKWRAATREEAQFSMPLAVAAALVHGRCGLGELEAERLAAPELQAVLAAMAIAPDPKWSGYEGGRVEVELADGTTLSEETTYAPGHPLNPMTAAQVETKFLSLAGEALGPEAAEKALAAVTSLAAAGSIGPLLAAARG